MSSPALVANDQISAAMAAKVAPLQNNGPGELTIVGFDQPVFGSLAYHDNGTFSYAPQPGFLGEDEFGYSIRSADGTVVRTVMTIRVETSTDGHS